MAAKTLLPYEFDMKCLVLLPDGGGSFVTPICGSVRAESIDAVKDLLERDYHVDGKSLIEQLVITEHRADGSTLERWINYDGNTVKAARDEATQPPAADDKATDYYWLGGCPALQAIPAHLEHVQPCTYKPK